VALATAHPQSAREASVSAREASVRLSSAERAGHRCTTRHAQAIYPFMAPGGLGGRGVFVGRDSSGAAFCYDPWVLYGEGALDDPNAIVLGKLGQGKSALVKTLLWRMLLFGRRAFVLDVKREYGPLCDAVGVRPISLVPGGGVRLNPLASRPEEHAQLELLRAVAVTAIGGPLTQIEAAGLREALRVVRDRNVGADPTLPEIATVLFEPTADMSARLSTTAELLAVDVRRAALAIQDLCEGPLRGMFDGPTSPGLDLDARLVVLDLHAVKDSPAVGILMACATAWMSALLARMAERPGRERLVNVADESWKIVQHTGLGEWFQSNFKLARQFGVMNLVVLHKLADLQAAGDAGSRAARIAEGLIADASTRVVYHQDESQVELTRTLLGLSGSEAQLISMLSAGQALWRVGPRSFVVQHYRSRLESSLTDTDTGMRVTAHELGRG
jgi:type IV secretory pathway VirB4 component